MPDAVPDFPTQEDSMRLIKKITLAVRKFIYWHFDVDRVAEAKIKKSIRIYHRGGFINEFRARFMWYRLQKTYTTSYPPQITIGKNLRIEHCMGSHIGRTAVFGDNVRIYQHVQVIAKAVGDQALRDKRQRRHAKIGNNVVLSCGCTIIGPVTIGDNSIIGANALVTHDVPPNSIVVGLNQIRPRKESQTLPTFSKNPWEDDRD